MSRGWYCLHGLRPVRFIRDIGYDRLRDVEALTYHLAWVALAINAVMDVRRDSQSAEGIFLIRMMHCVSMAAAMLGTSLTLSVPKLFDEVETEGAPYYMPARSFYGLGLAASGVSLLAMSYQLWTASEQPYMSPEVSINLCWGMTGLASVVAHSGMGHCRDARRRLSEIRLFDHFEYSLCVAEGEEQVARAEMCWGASQIVGAVCTAVFSYLQYDHEELRDKWLLPVVVIGCAAAVTAELMRRQVESCSHVASFGGRW